MTQSNSQMYEETMPIKVLYFASLKELFGRSEQQLSIDGLSTVEDVWRRVSEGYDVSQQVLYSINQEYAQADSLVKSGDEVAFFPPVTGG
ncbi:MAG: molybdopterin converting factor subunit 1 [Cycloclasticus sp.]|jgi:molybdopterin synthase sulfur carrier subunit|nr:molybdopterin converting factor subunit 1 [Cycloclasticus sp.]MDF1689469.1 molybdopterin converting factor subunit 1 [Cycloclasticus sp.]